MAGNVILWHIQKRKSRIKKRSVHAANVPPYYTLDFFYADYIV